MPTKVEEVISANANKEEKKQSTIISSKSMTHKWIEKYALVKDISYDRITPTHEIMNDLTYVNF